MESAGILFDYNGVLVDDEHLQHQAMAETVAEYGVELTDRLYNDFCLGRTDGEGFKNIRNAFLQLIDIPLDQLIANKVTHYQRIVREGSIMYPGIQDTIGKLAEDCELGVVTGALRLEVEPVLKEAGLFNFFTCVITADDVSRGKPNPEGYQKGTQALGIPQENIVVIEDTPNGIRAAKAAALTCIAVEHTVHRDQLGDADKIYAKVTDITAETIHNLLKAK